MPGICLTYHNGIIACGKPNGHLRTTLSCGVWLSQHSVLQTDRGRIHKYVGKQRFPRRGSPWHV